MKGRFRIQERNINGGGINGSHDDALYSSTDHNQAHSHRTLINKNNEEGEGATLVNSGRNQEANERTFQLRGNSDIESPTL